MLGVISPLIIIGMLNIWQKYLVIIAYFIVIGINLFIPGDSPQERKRLTFLLRLLFLILSGFIIAMILILSPYDVTAYLSGILFIVTLVLVIFAAYCVFSPDTWNALWAIILLGISFLGPLFVSGNVEPWLNNSSRYLPIIGAMFFLSLLFFFQFHAALKQRNEVILLHYSDSALRRANRIYDDIVLYSVILVVCACAFTGFFLFGHEIFPYFFSPKMTNSLEFQYGFTFTLPIFVTLLVFLIPKILCNFSPQYLPG